ncbi:MAG: histidinol-phosphate transaminase [Xylophilus ampelinus]
MNAVRHALGGPRRVLDFCVPVNPYFPTPGMLERITARLPDLLKHYPDYAATHEAHIAAVADLPPACVVVANGSTEIINALCQAAGGPMVTTVPTFGRWTDLPPVLGTLLHFVPHRREKGWRIDADELAEEAVRRRARTLVLCNPNNPTGAWFEHRDIEILTEKLAHLDAVVVDESFIDFSGLRSAANLATRSANLVIVKSLGKSLGWHGIRLGYAVANPARAAALRDRLPWWNINGIAAYVLEELARNPEARLAFDASFALVDRDRTYMEQALQRVPGLVVHPSRANFLYVELRPVRDGKALRADLLEKHGIYVRKCGNKIGSSSTFLRLAVLPRPSIDALVQALYDVLGAALAEAR